MLYIILICSFFTLFFLLIITYLLFKLNLKKLNKKIEDYKTISHICYELGFSAEETSSFLSILKDAKLKSPYLCFTDLKQLDELLKKCFLQIENSVNLSEQKKEIEKNILFEIKAKIERNFRRNLGLKSSKFINTGQKIIIQHKNKKYYAVVTDNLNQYLKFNFLSERIDRNLITKEFNTGDSVTVFFWRENDANYTFTSQLKINKKENLYAIDHSTNLNRSQKRKYIRISVNLAARYKELEQEQVKGSKEIEYTNLTDCRIVDISAGGLKFKSQAQSQAHNWIQVENQSKEIKDKYFYIEFYIGEKRLHVIGKMIRMYLFKTGKIVVTIKYEKVREKDKNIINQCIYNYL